MRSPSPPAPNPGATGGRPPLTAVGDSPIVGSHPHQRDPTRPGHCGQRFGDGLRASQALQQDVGGSTPELASEVAPVSTVVLTPQILGQQKTVGVDVADRRLRGAQGESELCACRPTGPAPAIRTRDPALTCAWRQAQRRPQWVRGTQHSKGDTH